MHQGLHKFLVPVNTSYSHIKSASVSVNEYAMYTTKLKSSIFSASDRKTYNRISSDFFYFLRICLMQTI